jgi:hypothetical protein
MKEEKKIYLAKHTVLSFYLSEKIKIKYSPYIISQFF